MNALIASLCNYVDELNRPQGVPRPGDMIRSESEPVADGLKPRRAVIDICFHLHSYAFTVSRFFEKVWSVRLF